MSYNITSWKIKEMRLELPLRFDFQGWLRNQPDRDEKGYENIGKRWCLEDKEDTAVQVNLVAQTWKLSVVGEDLQGVIEGDKLIATKLSGWTYDGSGYLYSDILLPLFKDFKGTLHAIVVWEHGDTIKQLSMSNGVIEERDLGA